MRAAPLREAGHELEVWLAPADGAAPDPPTYGAVVALGGVENPDADGEHPWIAKERQLIAAAPTEGVPVLGLCLGAQLLAQACSATCSRASPASSGTATAFCRLPAPPCSRPVPLGPQAFRVGDRAWGLQFHLEVDERTVNHWLDVAPQEATAAGESVDALRERTAVESPGSTERATRVARRLAALAGAGWSPGWRAVTDEFSRRAPS